MIVATALAAALLCLAPSASNAFVNTQNNVVTRGEPLSSLVMDRTDVFRPASTHPNTYLPGAPSSSQGIGYGVSSYGTAHGYGHGYGYNSHDYDRYNRYGRYSTYDNARSVNDRSYNSYNNYYSSSPSRYGSAYGSNDWNSGVRRINTAGTYYNGARSAWDNDVYGTGRSTYNNYNTGYNNYNNRYYNTGYNNNDWYNNNYSNRYTSGYGNYGTYNNNNDYYRTGSYYGGNGYNNYYNDRYNTNNYSNWNSLSRNNYYGRGTNWAMGSGGSNYNLDMDRRGAFEAGSTLASYSRPSRTALQLQGYNSGYSLATDQPRAFNPGYNWRK